MSWRKNTRCSSAGGFGPLVAPETTIVPPGLSDSQRVLPGRLADGLHHGVDPLRQPRAGLERLRRRRAPSAARALLLVAARHPHAAARRRGRARSARVATPPPAPWTSTVVAGPHAGLHEQHPVGGQPRRRQARGLGERQRRPAWARGCASAPRPARPACPGAARRAASASGRASRRRSSRGWRSPRGRSPRCRRRRRPRRRSRGSSAAAPRAGRRRAATTGRGG